MTEEMPGRPPLPKNSRFIVRSAEKNLPMPRFARLRFGHLRHSDAGASADGPWE